MLLAALSILICLLAVLSELPVVNAMFIDSGIYAYVGQEINRGHLLYRDIFEIKLPAVYYINALILRILPDSRWTLYACDICLFGLLLLLLSRILKASGIRGKFWPFGLLFATCYRIYPSFSGGNLNEHYFLLFFLLVIYLLLKNSSPVRDLVLGLCCVTLFMFKQSFLPVAIVPFVFYRRRITPNRFFLAGAGAALAFFLGIYLRALPYSWDCTFRYPAAWTASRGITLAEILSRWRRVWMLTDQGPGIPLLTLLGISLFAPRHMRAFAWSLTLASSVILFGSPDYFAHYSLVFLVPLIFAAIAAAQRLSPRMLTTVFVILSLLPVQFIVPRAFLAYRGVSRILHGQWHAMLHPVAHLILNNLSADDTIIMLPEYPPAYFVTGRRSPWRFYGFSVLVPSYYRQELHSLIRTRPPGYVYLEQPVEEFERVFGLSRQDYSLREVDRSRFGTLYAFSLAPGQSAPNPHHRQPDARGISRATAARP